MKTGGIQFHLTTPGAILICRGTPKGAESMARYWPLAPSWDLLKVEDLDAYTAIYLRDVLGRLDPAKVWRDLERMAGGHEPILLCYEAVTHPWVFCHRRLVARWFEANLGVEVPEALPAIRQPSEGQQRLLWDNWVRHRGKPGWAPLVTPAQRYDVASGGYHG